MDSDHLYFTEILFHSYRKFEFFFRINCITVEGSHRNERMHDGELLGQITSPRPWIRIIFTSQKSDFIHTGYLNHFFGIYCIAVEALYRNARMHVGEQFGQITLAGPRIRIIYTSQKSDFIHNLLYA